MIKLFRKIRQDLITENKFSKYILYAIGEIILVVIGILIALQINVWNQNRLAVNEEQAILKNMHTEFLQNRESLKVAVLGSEAASNSGKILFNLIGKQREEIKKHNIDSLFFISLDTGSFRPSENTISDLLQSGRLQILKNSNLKDLLHLWARNMKDYESTQNRTEIKIDDELIPYLTEKYSMKDIDMYGRLNWTVKTQLNIDKLQVFEDIKFENILDDYLFRCSGNRNNLNELEKILGTIIKETRSQND
ncbi:hypothetical protein [uncultured Winogradskyella sp.]|uniref:hypothetical protein n=1 Tax=uncultured Winogradskyella sp. TaxID=395353 RepID=UPI0030D7F9F3|tara:strand:- start:4460 stop:5209 length:750 start_codon:yes stop_codon:yes gene_type:complete